MLVSFSLSLCIFSLLSLLLQFSSSLVSINITFPQLPVLDPPTVSNFQKNEAIVELPCMHACCLLQTEPFDICLLFAICCLLQ
ncbi:hypothetical protein ACN38_g12239, partial [Penicillium nordicum]